MRRILAPAEFAAWFARFLPDIGLGEPATLFTPAAVSDRTDGKIAHLDGLNLSRAWCWRGIATGLDEPEKAVALACAERHLEASLPWVAGDYAGEHWLASFALLALLLELHRDIRAEGQWRDILARDVEAERRDVVQLMLVGQVPAPHRDLARQIVAHRDV